MDKQMDLLFRKCIGIFINFTLIDGTQGLSLLYTKEDFLHYVNTSQT